jgi:hypothetical protein
MRRASLSSRATALLGVTTLLTAAGLASGALVGVAHAVAATSVTPSAVTNTSTAPTVLTVNGADFKPGASVTLVPTVPGDQVAPITTSVDVPGSTSSALKVSATLTLAAPEPYDVVVTQSGGTETVTCAKCLTVVNPGRPTVTGVVADPAKADGFLIVSGTNFAKGARVLFVKPDGTADTGLTLTETTYPGATSLKGKYTALPEAAAGKHTLVVTNVDGQSSKGGVDFYQPKITSVSPAALGQGAQQVPLTVSGEGIRSGASLGIQQSSSSVSDITVGTATAAANGLSITAPVSVSPDGTPSARTLTVRSPDGAFATKTAALTIQPGPAINDPFTNPTVDAITPSELGQNGTLVATIAGSGFSTDPAAKPTFTFDDAAITAVTQSVSADGTEAVVALTAAPGATVGGHNLTITNPDFGRYSTTGDGTPGLAPYPLTVNPAPQVSGISPAAAAGGDTNKPVTLRGTGFDTSGMEVDFGPGITTNSVAVTSSTSAIATITVALTAAPGGRDVTVTNTSDRGRSTCTDCFGINSMSLTPTTGDNGDADRTISFSGAGASSGQDLSTTTRVVLQMVGAPAYQPDIAGTELAPGASAASASFNLTNAAPGLYNAVLTRSTGGPLSCSGCFTIIDGTPHTVTALSPAVGGRGAIDRVVTLTGTSFSRGAVVTIPDVTVSEATFTNPTSITVKVTVPADAPLGKKVVTVRNADGSSPAQLADGFEVVPAPAVTKAETEAADKKSLGQGATNRVVTIEGSAFSDKSVVSFSGSGLNVVTQFVDATHLKATVTAAADAATGPRDLTVKDSGTGGTSAPLASAITVTPAPKVALVSPSTLPAGKAEKVTVSGQGFAPGATVTIAGVDVDQTKNTVSADGTSLTFDAVVKKTASGGARTVTVKNTDGGAASCAACFTVTVPTTLVLDALPRTATAGQPVLASGRLVNSATGNGIGGKKVTVTFARAVGGPYTAAATTSTASGKTGVWSITFHPSYTTKVTAAYASESSNAAATSVARQLPVAALVRVTSPRSGATTAATSTLLVKGAVSPNKSGRTVGLYRLVNGVYRGIASAKIASNGSYVISVKLAKGSYTLRTGVGATPGNTAGNSAAFSAKRS